MVTWNKYKMKITSFAVIALILIGCSERNFDENVTIATVAEPANTSVGFQIIRFRISMNTIIMKNSPDLKIDFDSNVVADVNAFKSWDGEIISITSVISGNLKIYNGRKIVYDSTISTSDGSVTLISGDDVLKLEK